LKSSQNLSYEDVWQAFIEVEAKEKLVDFKIGSIYLWPLLRDRLMRDVAETLGIFEKRPESENVAELAGEGSIVASFQKSNIAVIPFLRRDKDGADPFSDFLVQSLRAEGFSPLVFGMGKADLNSGRPQIEVLERNFMRLYRNRAKLLVAPSIRRAHRQKYQRVISYLAAQLAGHESAIVTSRYMTFPRWLLVDFHAQRYGFKKLFKSAGVKTLVVVNAWKRGLIAGAQRAGVWVIEPQHGLLSSKLPLISWPASEKVSYLPNQLLVWGSYWAHITDAPSNVEKTIIGAPTKIVELARQNVARKPNTVLVISQSQQSSKVLEFTIRAAIANPEFKFVLKPHPQEDPITLGDISALVPTLPENLQFANPESSALPLIARAEFVVGVHSLALIEALALGAKVIAIDLPGYENVLPFVERGDITLTKFEGNLAEELKIARPSVNVNEYFAPAVSSKQLVQIITGWVNQNE
jgi:hypothetical protein